MQPYIIGVGGGSGSGKTTVVNEIINSAGQENVVVVQHDWYYISQPSLSFDERAKLNFDHPNSLETTLLIDQLKELAAYRPVACPVYDYSEHLRKDETQLVEPKNIIIVDGILIFTDEALRKLMNLKVFVDADSDLRFIRRMERDIKERDRTRENIVEQYLSSVKPMHDLFVESSKRYADIIIPYGVRNRVAIKLLTAQIMSVLSEK